MDWPHFNNLWCLEKLWKIHLAKITIFARNSFTQFRKNPCAHKIKSALPPPPFRKTQKYPPPPENEDFMGMEVFSCRKNAIFPAAHKIGAAISGPRIAGKTLHGHEDFSDQWKSCFPGDVGVWIMLSRLEQIISTSPYNPFWKHGRSREGLLTTSEPPIRTKRLGLLAFKHRQ